MISPRRSRIWSRSVRGEPLSERVIAMLRRPEGATVDEVAHANTPDYRR